MVSRTLPKTMASPAPLPLLGLLQEPVLFAPAQPIDALARRLDPQRGVDVAAAQVGDGPLVAQLAHLFVEEGVLG